MEEEDNEYTMQMKEELSQIPLGELKALQDKLGLKAFNKMKSGSKTKANMGATYKRLNKHRPAEFSARKPVPKQTPTLKEKTRRDPRFDDLSGEFNSDIFKTSYGFLDEMKDKEKGVLKKMMTETDDKEEKARLKELFKRMEQKEKAEKRKEKQLQLEKEWKKKEKEKVQEGKTPYFMKKSEKKTRIKEDYEKELKEKGKMEKYIERKNKKLSAKEKKRQTWKIDDV